jgi:hypothetical protein
MKLLISIALLFLHFGTYAQASKAKATDLMNESGLARQMSVYKTEIRKSLIEQIEPVLNRQRFSEEQKRLTYQLFDEDLESTVGEAIINDSIREQLIKELDDSVVEAELKFYRSDLGKRIAEVEAAPAPYKSLSAESRVELGTKIFAASSKTRQQLISTISKLNQSADLYIKSSAYAQLGFAKGAASLNTEALRLIDQELEKFEVNQQAFIDSYAAADSMDSALVYEPLSDEELQKFSEHIASPSARKYIEFMVRAVPLVVRDRAEALGMKLAMNNKGV